MSDWKNDNVEYVFACNYDNFNEEFKEKYDRDASENDWKLFKEKFSELRTSYICQNFHDGISEIIEGYYSEGFDEDKEDEDDEYVDEPCSGDEDDYDYHECTDHKCRYKGHWHKKSTKKDEVDGDGFVVCEHCGKGGGAHSSEDCLDLMREEAEKKVNLTVGA
jgi:hypothetical protein